MQTRKTFYIAAFISMAAGKGLKIPQNTAHILRFNGTLEYQQYLRKWHFNRHPSSAVLALKMTCAKQCTVVRSVGSDESGC